MKKEHSPEYIKLMQSDYWRKFKERISARDEWQCRLCGSNKNLECHHIRYSHLGNEANYPEDACLLCVDCHKKIHLYCDVCDSLKEYYEQKRHEARMRRGLY